MKRISFYLFFILLFGILFRLNIAESFEYEAYGSIQPELTYFVNGDGRHNQPREKSSIFGTANFTTFVQDDNAKVSIGVVGRFDKEDRERSYIDLQKFKYEFYFDDLTLKLGNEIVFWGVNESFHVVDIINQSILSEDLSGTKKLGQPMIAASLYRDYGDIDIYILPYFRERIFPGVDGRPRFSLEIDKNSITYESSNAEKNIDLAIRYSTIIDDFDLGITHFHGHARNPKLTINQSTFKFDSYYPLLSQTGIDIQATKDAWLYKLEAVSAKFISERHLSMAGGIEYTFYGLNNSSQDLGIIMEYLFDDRNNHPFNNEGSLGLRWTKNDINSSTLLAGSVIDLNGSSNQFFVEYEQRLKNDFKFFIETVINGNIDNKDYNFAFKEDTNLTIKIAKYF
jgi:hypothetical protein